LFEKTYATKPKNVKSHVFWILKKNVKYDVFSNTGVTHTRASLTAESDGELKVRAKAALSIEQGRTCVISSQCFESLTLLVRRQEGHPTCAKKTGCWLVGGDILTGVLHVLQLQLLPLPPSPLAPIKSRTKTFWYRLTEVYLENGL